MSHLPPIPEDLQEDRLVQRFIINTCYQAIRDARDKHKYPAMVHLRSDMVADSAIKEIAQHMCAFWFWSLPCVNRPGYQQICILPKRFGRPAGVDLRLSEGTTVTTSATTFKPSIPSDSADASASASASGSASDTELPFCPSPPSSPLSPSGPAVLQPQDPRSPSGPAVLRLQDPRSPSGPIVPRKRLSIDDNLVPPKKRRTQPDQSAIVIATMQTNTESLSKSFEKISAPAEKQKPSKSRKPRGATYDQRAAYSKRVMEFVDSLGNPDFERKCSFVYHNGRARACTKPVHIYPAGGKSWGSGISFYCRSHHNYMKDHRIEDLAELFQF